MKFKKGNDLYPHDFKAMTCLSALKSEREEIRFHLVLFAFSHESLY